MITKRNVNDNVNVNVNDNVNDNDNVSSGTSADTTVEYPYAAVIDYLNIKTGAKYLSTSRDTRKLIRERCDEGFKYEDFMKVIDKKVQEWKGTDYEKFLRPSTLFGTKFESYLNQQGRLKVVNGSGTQFNNFTPRDYDYLELENALLDASKL